MIVTSRSPGPCRQTISQSSSLVRTLVSLERPDVLASIQNAEEHPEQLVRRKLRDAPADLDWENPD